MIFFSLFFFNSQQTKITDSNKIETLNKKVDSLIKVQNDKKLEILDERIKQATETISNQNSLISSFGTLYTVITIIFALIGVILPILTYQFGIKPSQKALEDFEKNSEKKFNDYLKDNKEREIDNAIENLSNEDLAVKNTAVNFLSLNYHLGISDKQILGIINHLNNKNDIDDTTRGQLYNTISNQKNENVFNYFKQQLKDVDEKNILIYYAIKSCSFFEYDQYKSELKEYIKKNQNFLTVSTYVQLLAKHHLLNFFNDENIVSILAEVELEQIKSNWKHYLNNWKISETDFQKTKIFEIVGK